MDATLEAVYQVAPDEWERFGKAGKSTCRELMDDHLDYLAQALRYDSPQLFAAYVNWLGEMFTGMDFSRDLLSRTLHAFRSSLSTVLPSESARIAYDFAKACEVATTEPALGHVIPLGQEADLYLETLLAGDRAKAAAQVMGLLDGGMPIKSVYLDVFQASQLELGRRWLLGAISVAQEHFCTAATQANISRLYPSIFSGWRNGRSMVATSVGEEFHEIGVRMVADFFELDGWSSHYLGANSPPSSIVDALRERKAVLLCVSATMVSILPRVDAVIRLVRAAFPRGEVKIMVGGGPFNVAPGLWERIGADGWAPDASVAVEAASTLFP
jgi:methanogenic corrinoid protein MtbC1